MPSSAALAAADPPARGSGSEVLPDVDDEDDYEIEYEEVEEEIEVEEEVEVEEDDDEEEASRLLTPINQRDHQNDGAATREVGTNSRGNERVKCNHCKRWGHEEPVCRLKNKQCLKCGSSEHFRKLCPLKTELAPRKIAKLIQSVTKVQQGEGIAKMVERQALETAIGEQRNLKQFNRQVASRKKAKPIQSVTKGQQGEGIAKMEEQQVLDTAIGEQRNSKQFNWQVGSRKKAKSIQSVVKRQQGEEIARMEERQALNIAIGEQKNSKQFNRQVMGIDSKENEMVCQAVDKSMLVCNYCEYRGHEESNCYRKNQQCFACGSFEHFYKLCPHPKNQQCFRCGSSEHFYKLCPLKTSLTSRGKATPNTEKGFQGDGINRMEEGQGLLANIGEQRNSKKFNLRVTGIELKENETVQQVATKSMLVSTHCKHCGYEESNCCRRKNQECIRCGSSERFCKLDSFKTTQKSGEKAIPIQLIAEGAQRGEGISSKPQSGEGGVYAQGIMRDTSQVLEPRWHEEHFQSGCSTPGKSMADQLSDGRRVRGYSGNCAFAGLSETRQKEETLVDGKEITRDRDDVASLFDQWEKNNEKTTLSGGEVNALVLNVGFPRKAANSDLYCEKETDQTPRENSKQVASRVRPRSTSLCTEFSNGSKRQAITCESFAKGWCVKGDSCNFLHTKDHVAIAGLQKVGILDTAEKKLDDEASSLLHISRPKSGESPRLKSEMQEFPLHKDDPLVISPISLERKAFGREYTVEDQCHYTSPTAKDRSFHGMRPSSSLRSPENCLCDRISSHMKSLEEMTCKRSQFMPNDHDMPVPNASFNRSQLSFGYSSRNLDPYCPHKLLDRSQDQLTPRSASLKRSSSPFSGSNSENLSRSDILGETNYPASSKTKIRYDWEPSVPFRPSFLLSQRLLTAATLYDPIRDSIEHTSTGGGLSKSLLSGQGSSIIRAQIQSNDASVSKGILSSNISLNKYSTKNFSGKDSYASVSGMMENVDAQSQSKSTSSKEEKLLSTDQASNVKEHAEVRNAHDLELISAGSRRKTEAKEEGIGQKVEAAVDLKVDGHLQKESRTLKYFHAALVEFVKELLKPTWREGILTKDAHKIIVKKTVDKVLSTLQPQQIPNTSESVKQYLSLSEPKLSKLVEAYVDKHLKS